MALEGLEVVALVLEAHREHEVEGVVGAARGPRTSVQGREVEGRDVRAGDPLGQVRWAQDEVAVDALHVRQYAAEHRQRRL